VEGIREVAGWANEMGIIIALQNHAPVISPGYEDALVMIQEIDRTNVKLCLDVPLFYDRQEDEYAREAVQKCGKQIVHMHYGAWNFSKTNGGEIM
jgi:sugar phosphate isomerase/epimerase